jgi:large subunit ribosomal protein L9
MKVLFLEDVPGVAQGGDIKNVKNGFARNYLIPKNLATPATQDSLQRIDRLKKQAESTRLKTLKDMKALGDELSGTRVDIEMRAGASGQLYGSVTNTIVAEKLASMTSREIDRRVIQIPESIRETGTYSVQIRLHPEVRTDVTLLVHPIGMGPEEFLESLEDIGEQSEDAGLSAEESTVDESDNLVEVPVSADVAETDDSKQQDE